MFRAKSLLDEILGEATGEQFSPVIQQAPAPTPAPASTPLPWFNDPAAGWNYSTETMAGPPGMFAASNLAQIIDADARKLGYSGGPAGGYGEQGEQGGVYFVNPDFTDWLQSQGLQLGGESANVNGIGGVNAFLTDQSGKRVGQQDYATDDTGAFMAGIAGLGLGAFSAVNGGVGAASGAGEAGGLFANEGAAQLAAADLAVTPEAFTALAPEIGGLGEVAALSGSQVGALNPNMFANEGLAQLTANPPVVSAAELSAITPNVGALGPVNMFANEGAKQLAANPPTVTPAELSAVTPSVPPPVLPTSGVNPVRAGEIAGYQTNGTLPSSAAVNAGGGLLDTLTGAAGTATQWLKDNPLMGRLLMSGAGALVSGLGGSGGGSSATPTNYGPAKQWTSPIQSGLLSAPRNVQQVQPGGLLGGQGVANSGAWQWRK